MPFLVALLVVVTVLGLGYQPQVPLQSSSLVSSQPSLPRSLAEPEAPRGINGRIGYNAMPLCPVLGGQTLVIPPPPSGSILVRGASGRETFVKINWFFFCGSFSGTFQVTLHPGSYSVDFTGDKGVCIEPRQLPVNVGVEPHGFTQVNIHILTYPSTCLSMVS